MLGAVKLIISGIVQGVGFRPAIARICHKMGINGYVKNLGGGEVEIWIEGEPEKVQYFLKTLKENVPPTSKIEKIIVEEKKPLNIKGFTILRSAHESFLISEIPPDIAICNWCLNEINSKESRRYNYAFNACAWCGPRYSIIERLPYDRENTSWIDFPLCHSCIEEYNDPENIRRFHAEGNSCPICGPKLSLLNNNLEVLDVADPLLEASKLIDEGYIVAIKGIGGYHLAALATNDDVVSKLRLRKQRLRQPFAIMALDIEIARGLVVIDNKAEKLLTSYERPIVILQKTENSNVSSLVAPGLNTIGIYLPYTGIHYILLKNTKDKFAIMTSGNPTGQPMITSEEQLKRLNKIADFFLIHNRRIINRIDDSVVRFTNGEVQLLRRARGYAPTWIETSVRFNRPVIAFGSDLHNVGAIGVENKIIPTQYIGDVDEYESFKDLETYLYRLCQYYKINPREAILVADLHPLYRSLLLAEKWCNAYDAELIRVQHHKAHMASVMLDNSHTIDEPAVAITVDGAGYGEDNAIWGGEILSWDGNKIHRCAHLEYHVMPGGDLATKYPARMLASILGKILSEEEVFSIFEKRRLLEYLPIGIEELHYCVMSAKNGRGQLTSSTGRVLDSISVLLRLCKERSYEGEPAILLEDYAAHGKEVEVAIPDIKDKIIPTSDIILQIVNLADTLNGHDIAYTALLTIGKLLGEVAKEEALKYDLDKIYISGGAAVNEYIIRGIESAIKNSGVMLKMHKKLPPNDGCISAGQVFITKMLGLL